MNLSIGPLFFARPFFRTDPARRVDSPRRAAYTRRQQLMPRMKTHARKRAVRKGARLPADSAHAKPPNLLFEILCLAA
jgi:hypothetical protein